MRPLICPALRQYRDTSDQTLHASRRRLALPVPGVPAEIEMPWRVRHSGERTVRRKALPRSAPAARFPDKFLAAPARSEAGRAPAARLPWSASLPDRALRRRGATATEA